VFSGFTAKSDILQDVRAGPTDLSLNALRERDARGSVSLLSAGFFVFESLMRGRQSKNTKIQQNDINIRFFISSSF